MREPDGTEVMNVHHCDICDSLQAYEKPSWEHYCSSCSHPTTHVGFYTLKPIRKSYQPGDTVAVIKGTQTHSPFTHRVLDGLSGTVTSVVGASRDSTLYSVDFRGEPEPVFVHDCYLERGGSK